MSWTVKIYSRLLDFYLTQYKHGFMFHHVDLIWKKLGVLDMMINRIRNRNCVLRHLCKDSLYLVCIFFWLVAFQNTVNWRITLFSVVCFWFVSFHFVILCMLLVCFSSLCFLSCSFFCLWRLPLSFFEIMLILFRDEQSSMQYSSKEGLITSAFLCLATFNSCLLSKQFNGVNTN